GPVKARHRASACATREAAAGSVRAACTTFSRPSAIDKIVRPSGNIIPWSCFPWPPPPTRHAWSRLRLPSAPASAAWSRRCTLPERAAFSMRSNPLMKLPTRASMPSRSSVFCRSSASIRSLRSAATWISLFLNACWRAALILLLALEASSSVRVTPIHAPRPAARARTSGATSPSGESASRISSSFDAVRRERMQVRSGTCASKVSLLLARNRVLLGCRGGWLIFEPVRAGGHDDLIALLFAEAVLGEDSALVLGPIARLAAAGLDSLLLDQLVRGEIGEIVERSDVGLAQSHQHLLGEVRELGERILDAQLAALFTRRGLAALECLGRSVLQLRGDVVIEPLDRGDLLDGHVGDFLETGEAFRDQQLRQRLVDVELVLEQR